MNTPTCPSWCEFNHAAWDDEPDGHDGPSFGDVSVGVAFGDPLSVYRTQRISRRGHQTKRESLLVTCTERRHGWRTTATTDQHTS